jgi:hypothetical protein
MMSGWILVVIFVANGKSYEEPVYAKKYDSEQVCKTYAAKYPKSGTAYKTAVCVPLVK